FMRHQWAQWAATERMDQLADAGQEVLKKKLIADMQEKGLDVDEEYIQREVERAWRKDPRSIIALSGAPIAIRNAVIQEMDARQRAQEIYDQAFRAASQESALAAVGKSAGRFLYDFATLGITIGWRGLRLADEFQTALKTGFQSE